MFYDKELKAIKKINRYRKRELFDEKLSDFASNDYLCLSCRKKLLKKAFHRVKRYKSHSSKASLLVNGYHPIHKEFEKYIAKLNDFEKAICVGSGFLANISLFEALPRRGDLLLFDEEFHASGLITKKLSEAKVEIFPHNDHLALEKIVKSFRETSNNRIIIAVEGIYSMSGDMVKKEIFDIADNYGAILVVDEAHSVGVVGERLLGVFEHYGIKPKNNHIKMGTLGKALGSYGAYILCSSEIESYLLNRAKAIIYTTALSPFDTALAYEGFKYIEKKGEKLKKKIKKRQKEAKKYFDVDIEGLILPIEFKSSTKVLHIKEKLLKKGFIVGAIRPPTVKKPILRVILRIDQDRLTKLLKIIKKELSL
ncbi:MAG: pyridoxal phosphate-dependent aminotransferase family protein [Epsilonproteobacteria bacterium]|nr:pyridoxal phosphate-dependent aminotransferase family protein [Campylobacterota bacterium]